ncbi:class I SAM-dependent methyltransferase [Streptomyces sp. NPDC057638]|uniref:class I SAM-dependent methyltransferase n=1 Tax=Streptomyces sp. NPDC057638 TaxID=3346190 RepID=UPI00367C1417
MARQLDEQIAARYPVGQRLRILDVGMGRGVQALRLARAGHTITGLESDEELLRAAEETLATEPEGIRERVTLLLGDSRETGVHFLPGSFDVVLCHEVLLSEQTDDGAALLAGLARMLAPGGLLSLLVRNAGALAMGPGLARDWDGALAALDSDIVTDRSGRTVRAHRLDALTSALAGIAAPLHAWYGVQVFTPWGAADSDGGGDGERLLLAEDRAGRTDPYRGVAALLHLCGVRG